ncbi:MAG: protein kinase [Deltaproteobacteria bacterium]|nr:protein kinase [Deltaproteobacteria bacterium]
MPVAGQVVGGRYRLVRPLGEGGMASVWAAEHLTMGNLVALKIISPELLQHPVAIARFNREARAAAKLRTPYVVQIYDHDVDPELGPYIAMEMLEGESLADRLDRERILPPIEISRILTQVGKGLMRAHAAGIVHRDLKPDNIFLSVDEDDGEMAKVLDFGVAKADSPLAIKESSKTVAGTLLGTLNYMSPEQAQGRDVNHLSDLWALGVIAFESLTGRRPFDEDAPGALVMEICAHPMPVPSKFYKDLPPGFDAWFAHACNRDPALRFQSAAELTRALAEVCDPDQQAVFDAVSGSFPVHRPLSVDPMTANLPIPDIDPPQETNTGRKRLVLEIVDSMPPPPMDAPAKSIPSEVPTLGPDDLEVVEDLEVPQEDYYVTNGTLTIGPVTFDVLKAGYEAGDVGFDASAWTEGWDEWKPLTEALQIPSDKQKRRVLREALLNLGPAAKPPAEAPAPPVRSLLLGALAPPPISAVRPAPAKKRGQEPVYYLAEGTVSVGPVRASTLHRGLLDDKVPAGAVLWRSGWHEWKAPAEAKSEVEAWEAAPASALRDLPGLDALGKRSLPPPTAPPTIAPNLRGRSK